MAHEFPPIVDFTSAYRFALEAELAGADFAAAAEVIAPDETWRERLEELTCAHDDRVQKLRAAEAALGAKAPAPLNRLDGVAFATALAAEPEPTWPAAAEQMAAVEDAIAAYHEAFVASARDPLAGKARIFAKAAAQARAAAAELRAMLA